MLVHPSWKWLWNFSSPVHHYSLVMPRAHFNDPSSSPPSVFFYLNELLPCLLCSFILQGITPICLISQAAFLPCISRWGNDSDQGCYLSPLAALSRSLTFTIGFRSVHIPAVVPDQFCVWLARRKPWLRLPVESTHQKQGCVFYFEIQFPEWYASKLLQRQAINWTHLLEKPTRD